MFGMEYKMKQLSIIIPFYNRESYLEKCLESVLLSDCHDIELILIDDASTDSGGGIAHTQYKESNFDVQIITHEKRTGPSASRNEGIRYAQGEYLYFMDSDDSIVSEELKNIIYILTKNQDIDILLVDYQQILHDRLLSVKKPVGTAAEGMQTMRMVLENTYWNKQLPAQAWRYFVRRELVVKNQINFPESLSYGEDSIFSMRLFQIAHNVYYYPKVFYNYRIDNEDSLTKQAYYNRWKSQEYFKERFHILGSWMQREKESTFLKQWFEQWLHQCIREFLFEKDWEQMTADIGKSCCMIPRDYMSVLPDDETVDIYLAKYRENLFKELRDAKNVYLLPACQDNVLLAEKWRKFQIRISGFLDNNTSPDNHNLKSVFEYGYTVENLKGKLEKNDLCAYDLYIICHWQSVTDSIFQQLSEAGICKESIITINW